MADSFHMSNLALSLCPLSQGIVGINFKSYLDSQLADLRIRVETLHDSAVESVGDD
jgi:hypothetical protein